MTYINTANLRKMLGNIGSDNVPDETLTDAQTFADGTINSKFNVIIPPGNLAYGRCVGIAYMLGKVFAQFGNETEAVRSLDFKVAMELLKDLKQDMIDNGVLDNLQGVSQDSMLDDMAPGAEYATRPLNKHGVIVFGVRSRGGVSTSEDVSNPIVPATPE